MRGSCVQLKAIRYRKLGSQEGKGGSRADSLFFFATRASESNETTGVRDSQRLQSSDSQPFYFSEKKEGFLGSRQAPILG